jgi:hypothetical protein
LGAGAPGHRLTWSQWGVIGKFRVATVVGARPHTATAAQVLMESYCGDAPGCFSSKRRTDVRSA